MAIVIEIDNQTCAGCPETVLVNEGYAIVGYENGFRVYHSHCLTELLKNAHPQNGDRKSEDERLRIQAARSVA